MHEPEEPDESTPPAMRRVFDELEAEFEAGLRREAEQEAMAAVRAEVGATLLWEQLARRREPVRVELADGTVCDGTIESVGSDYLEVAEHDLGEARRRGAVRARRFVGFAAVVAVTLPPERR